MYSILKVNVNCNPKMNTMWRRIFSRVFLNLRAGAILDKSKTLVLFQLKSQEYLGLIYRQLSQLDSHFNFNFLISRSGNPFYEVRSLFCENFLFYILWKKSRLKSTFLPYHEKKHYSTLEMDTFKILLLLYYLASLDNKPRT